MFLIDFESLNPKPFCSIITSSFLNNQKNDRKSKKLEETFDKSVKIIMTLKDGCRTNLNIF